MPNIPQNSLFNMVAEIFIPESTSESTSESILELKEMVIHFFAKENCIARVFFALKHLGRVWIVQTLPR